VTAAPAPPASFGRSRGRVIVAFALAPWVGIASTEVALVLANVLLKPPASFDFGAVLLLFAVIAWMSIVIGYPTSILLGVPAWFCFRRLRVRKLSAFILSGGVMAFTASMFLLLPFWGTRDRIWAWPEALHIFVLPPVMGAISGAFLWWMAVRSNGMTRFGFNA
jgi:hypothetical protein